MSNESIEPQFIEDALEVRRHVARAYGSLGKIQRDNARIRSAEKDLWEALEILNEMTGGHEDGN